MTRLNPHLAWFIGDNGYPYLYRYDTMRRKMPGKVPYPTAAAACEAVGMDLENFIRSR